jgi:protein-S-isoprenylcysteine O-methyltransferase Ste14
MTTTTYVIISSVQLIGVCVLWSPSGTVWHPFAPPLAHLSNLAYGASWLFLAKAMLDSGLSLQSGALGWLSVFRGKQPKYPDMPERGTFRHSRQPIYLAFLLILISSPVWTPDKVFFAIFWGSYLVFAPRLKERRLERAYGERFRAYQKRTPYFLPHLPAVPAPVKAFASFILHLLN